MATDFASEFAKVFGNSCPPQTDWTQPRYFDSLNNDCYASEAALLSSLTSEAYNKFGFEVYYFIKEHDTKFDPLLGEDQLENVKRRFALQVYTDNVPQLQKQYQIQGMVYSETVTLQCTVAHFDEASKINFVTGKPEYESAIPKIGDLMYFKYSDLYYEVINVKKFAEGTAFLSTPINYTFIVRVWRNSHENVDELNVNDDNMEHLRSYVELGETFNVDVDMGKHSPDQTIVTPEQKPHSTVEAKGDALSINDTVKWENLRKSKNNDSMDVLYNPNKDYEKFEEYINGVGNVIGNYNDTFNEISDKTSEISHETAELEKQLTDLQNKIETNVNTINKQMDDFDDEIKFDIETIQYTPKKKE